MSSMQINDTTNGGEENNLMTIEEMKARYSQADFEAAMFTPDYVKYYPPLLLFSPIPTDKIFLTIFRHRNEEIKMLENCRDSKVV
ncbi:hypothetical protein MGYG_08879 [Nannizzia gypsea CBS 118893]|uniref:Uncharacterized protein n=1 Tax=Arthroderma gypseum (strain ATCC MYA-4604 / CBS 118893) TaxID=535722 RepID=E5R2A0_ARTGP|nr:hypothetical protein MGYG_08879 [Nannizzia gypsea CBS 118893]EFQ96990.1 hypothetical protein MGYG_08879 [Nannizzia gypsea CBS 118893]